MPIIISNITIIHTYSPILTEIFLRHISWQSRQVSRKSVQEAAIRDPCSICIHTVLIDLKWNSLLRHLWQGVIKEP